MTAKDSTVGIVGMFAGNHLGGSLVRAADKLGWAGIAFDATEAEIGSRLGRSLLRRIGLRRPLHLGRFGRSVADACARQGVGFLIATGRAPLAAIDLRRLRAAGVTTGLFSSDDPWSAGQRAEWYLAALPAYDVVFTPRRHTVPDFEAIGCAHVETLPFGYDERFTTVSPALGAGPDVLFVGGADPDRAGFMTAFVAAGVPVSVVGGYWGRYPIAGVVDLGHRPPETVAALTASAKVNLCLIRRANRDGHVMRTYEMAATGAAMVVEDTADHRALFGAEGSSVLYFGTPADAAAKARMLLADDELRLRLAAEARQCVVSGGNTYSDRLRTMLRTLAEAKVTPSAGLV